MSRRHNYGDVSGWLTLAAVVVTVVYFGAHFWKACEAGSLPACRVEWHELAP